MNKRNILIGTLLIFGLIYIGGATNYITDTGMNTTTLNATSIYLKGTLSCSQALETDANGLVQCGTDADTNASTACAGTTTYLDGEGNCDDISGVYVHANDWTTIDSYPASCPANYYVQTLGDTLTCVNVVNDTDTNTNAASICAGTTTYLDGEGNCDDISGVYVQAADWTTIDNYPATCPANYYVQTIGDTLTCVNVVNDTDTDTYNSSTDMIEAVNITAWYQIRVNCSNIVFDSGLGSSSICDGLDNTGAAAGENFWIDNGTFLSPNASYANNIIVQGYIRTNDWSNVSITESQITDLEHTVDTYNTTEEMQDATMAYIDDGTQTHITVTYQDATNDMDFVVSDDWWNSCEDAYACGWWNEDADIPADEISESKINFTTACTAVQALYVSGNDLACHNDLMRTEDEVEAYIFDDDNTANLNMTDYNITFHNNITMYYNGTHFVIQTNSITFSIVN